MWMMFKAILAISIAGMAVWVPLQENHSAAVANWNGRMSESSGSSISATSQSRMTTTENQAGVETRGANRIVLLGRVQHINASSITVARSGRTWTMTFVSQTHFVMQHAGPLTVQSSTMTASTTWSNIRVGDEVTVVSQGDVALTVVVHEGQTGPYSPLTTQGVTIIVAGSGGSVSGSAPGNGSTGGTTSAPSGGMGNGGLGTVSGGTHTSTGNNPIRTQGSVN